MELGAHHHFHPACFCLSGRARCTQPAATALPMAGALQARAPGYSRLARGPRNELGTLPGPSHVVSPLPQVRPPWELNALYLEQNKAQEETEPGSRARLHILSWLQQFRGTDAQTGMVLITTSVAGCQELRRPLRAIFSAPSLQPVSTPTACSKS